MKKIHMILSGLGGQGILFMTRVLAGTALRKGVNVLGAETHGMAQRGGSVVSHLKIGDAESSLVNLGGARFLLALEEHEAYRNLPFLAKGGTMIVNTASAPYPRAEVQSYLTENGMRCRSLSAGRLSLDMGAPRSVNLALIGFMAAGEDTPFSASELRETISEISPERFRALNIQVFDAGLARGQE